jgi:hypothetical protein
MLVTLFLNVPLDWRDQGQFWLAILLILGVFYVLAGLLVRSVNPVGKLDWRGRRYMKGGTLLLLLFFIGFEVQELFRGAKIGITVTALLYAVLGLLFLSLVRWWWRDSQREKTAYHAFVEKIHQEGRELVAPPISAGKKAWRWTVNGYALFLLVAGLYVLVRYLVRH